MSGSGHDAGPARASTARRREEFAAKHADPLAQRAGAPGSARLPPGQGREQRLSGVAREPDEHRLQAVLRRHPEALGLEQPVPPELPARGPRGNLGSRGEQLRGRGYVDLAGLDATGALVLVETKLGGDDMLVPQGLEDRIWVEANRARLTFRLD